MSSAAAPAATAAGATTTPLPPQIEFQPPCPQTLTAQILLRAIRAQIILLYGDHGSGVTSSGLAIKYLSQATATFILRTPRESFRQVWAALAWMTRLPGATGGGGGGATIRGGDEVQVPCVMRVVRVSGTVRKVEMEAVRLARLACARAVGHEGGSGSGGSGGESGSGSGIGGATGDGLLGRLFGGGKQDVVMEDVRLDGGGDVVSDEGGDDDDGTDDDEEG
ncbi:MAG: hypothetical protein M1825_002499 [Sarcosagium campestre]|nr:MAG: hypothetical protein M1825_002499 [Sarcosagium campestre]